MPDTKPRWKLACINWGCDPSWEAPKALVYCLVDGEAMAERFFPDWRDAVAWLDERGAALLHWAQLLADRRESAREEWEAAHA